MERVSLLWPSSSKKEVVELEDQTLIDLDIYSTVKHFSNRKQIQTAILEIISKMPICSEDIEYRQLILEDLLNNDDIKTTFIKLQPFLESLFKYGKSQRKIEHPVRNMIARISELDSYIECLDELHIVFERAGKLKSPGLNKLKCQILNAVVNDNYKKLKKELPKLRKSIRGVSSISLGVNLTPDLKPDEVTLLSINNQKFRGNQLLKSLFSKKDDYDGIAKLHTSESEGWNKESRLDDPTLIPIFKDVYEIMKKSSAAIIKSLKKYESIDTSFLSIIIHELDFYLGACTMVNSLKKRGLDCCKPSILDMDENRCYIKDYFNLNLTIACDPVKTDIVFEKGYRAAILTGPNGGGKTVFIQGLAICQILFQNGLFIPGVEANISPVDGIYTHYQIEEKPEENKGRFGEEASRLNYIFSKVTKNSLILMNESFSSTNAGESLYLAEDIMKIVIKMGGWVIFATHMHELAQDRNRIGVISLICQAEENTMNGSVKRLYKVIKAPPKGVSYAKELANRYGISYDHLSNKLESRGVFC